MKELKEFIEMLKIADDLEQTADALNEELEQLDNDSKEVLKSFMIELFIHYNKEQQQELLKLFIDDLH